MNHERVPASYWLHAHGSSKASTAWRDVGWQTRQKNAHALSHSGRKGGVRRRETVGVGHAGGRARARHIYRAAAHGHAAHFAHTRSLRPDAPVSCHRQGGRGGAHSYPVREPRADGGLLWLAGWRTRLGRHPCIWAAPRHPCATQTWRWEATRPGCGGGRRTTPHKHIAKSRKVPIDGWAGGDPKHVAGERAGGRRGALPHQNIPQAGAPSRDHVAENAALVRSRPLMSSYVLSLFERTV